MNHYTIIINGCDCNECKCEATHNIIDNYNKARKLLKENNIIFSEAI